MKTNQEKQKPEMNYRVGAVRAAVWKHTNRAKDGRVFETSKVVLDRAYKDANDQWQHTNSLDMNDVPKAILALSKAYEHVATKTNGNTGLESEPVITEEAVR
jgi:hypothetical protein